MAATCDGNHNSPGFGRERNRVRGAGDCRIAAVGGSAAGASGSTVSASGQNVAVQLFVEPDDHRLTDAQGRGPEIAGRPEHGRHRCRCGLATRELVELLSLRDVDARRPLRERCSIRLPQLAAGGDGFFDIYRTGFQKLGCFGAAGSAAAVVVPVDGLGHVLFLSVVIAWHSNLFCGVGEIGVYQ